MFDNKRKCPKMGREILISLKFRLTIVTTLLLALISLFIYFYFPGKFEEERLSSLQEKANSIAVITAYGVSTDFYFDESSSKKNEGNLAERKESSDHDIEELIKNEEIRYVIIFKDDSTLYEFNQFTASMYSYEKLGKDAISYKWSVLKSHAPIMVEGEKVGDIYLGYSLQPVFSNMAEIRESIGIVSLILFVIGSILVYLIGVLFIKPLNNMVVVVKKVFEGDLKQRAIIVANDEIGYLSNSFNEMMTKISQNQIEMDIINKELEQQVIERTEEIEKASISLRKENSFRKKAEENIARSLKEKEVLLKEIHHRVKNNLQIVSSLFFFQSQKLNDPKMIEMFREGQNRVKSMALIHEKLYQSSNLASIDFRDYVQNLLNTLIQSYGINHRTTKFINNIEQVKLSVDLAVPCGLIINELISNSFKHAFKNKEAGELKIDMRYDENNNINLIVSDNGEGMPEGFKYEESNSLGIKLIHNLTRQMKGHVEFYNDNGTNVRIIIPHKELKKAS